MWIELVHKAPFDGLDMPQNPHYKRFGIVNCGFANVVNVSFRTDPLLKNN
jgi:hypothetical protein